MIGTKITIKNHDTGESIVINDHESDPQNVIALQKFPTFETEVRSNNTPRSGAHGEFRLPSYYSGMSIVLQGVIAGEDEAHVWAIKKQFDAIMAMPRSGFSKVVESERITPALAINECTNPSGKFSTTDWDDIDAVISISGDESIEVETDTADESGIEQVVSEVAKNQGDDYYASCDIENAEGTDRTFRIRVQARDSGESVLSEAYEDLIVAGGEIERISVALADIPANVEDIRVAITRLTDDAIDGDIFRVSNVLIVKNPPSNINPETDYFDGDSDDLTLLEFDWNGANGNSSSSMFRKTFASMFRNSVRISFTNPDGKNVFVDATPVKAVSYDRALRQDYRLDFQIVLRSNFPVLLIDDTTPDFYTGQFGVLQTGLKLPMQIPFVLGQEFVENGMTINAETAGFALVRMYGSDNGSIINPRITNLTNGSTVRIIRPLLGSNSYFLIDGISQTMTDQNGQSVQQYSDGDFIYLEAGENILLYSADEAIPN